MRGGKARLAIPVVALQIRVKDLQHGDVSDACIVQVLQRASWRGLLGKQEFAGVMAKLVRLRDVAGQLESCADQRSRRAKAHSLGLMRLDRCSVTGKRGIPLRSAGLVVNELTGADDDLMTKRSHHDGGPCDFRSEDPSDTRH